jgi:hypothetical protein
MAAPRRRRYLTIMMSTTTASTAPLASVRTTGALAGLVLAAFGVFSTWVVYREGYLGFLTLADREPWALQMLLDLVIACTVAIGWVRADGKKRGITTWPFVALTVFLGSIGVLWYLVRRAFAPPTAA